jgi:hypothetical protein
MALHFLPIFERNEAFLLVVPIDENKVCVSHFYDTVISLGFCQKVECHKVIL